MIDDYINKWINKADHDLKIVELAMINEDELINITDVVCFHCQQAVEKLLKAYLISKKINFPKTREIELLLELCI